MRIAPVSAQAETNAPNHPSYPVNLVVRDRSCLVVGGGMVARRKIAGLVDAGAVVTVVAPTVLPEIVAMGVRVHERPYQRGEVASYRLAITCTDSAEVNAQVYADAEAAGIWVNSADDPENCAFTLPAVARQGPLSIAISTTGKSPALATWLRRHFERELQTGYADLLDLLVHVRAEARRRFGTSEIPGWQEALDEDLLALVAKGDIDAARRRLHHHLKLDPELETT